MARSTIETVDVKINAIRTKALGHEHTQCPTCTRPAEAPFRAHDATGTIVAGCIDAFHGPSLAGVASASTHWHLRPQAVAMRRATLAHLRAL